MDATISWNFSNLEWESIGDPAGLRPVEFDNYLKQAEQAHADLMQRRNAGELPFYDLPNQQENIEAILSYAEAAQENFDDIVVLGIGGSSLGPAALYSALGRQVHDEQKVPRLHFPDNVDPYEFDILLRQLNLERTLFNVVTKSGGTPETITQFLIVRERLEHKLKDRYKDHLVFTTDPEKGHLRRIAEEEGIKAFSINPGVGGRFSVLTPVGFLPAALAGIDIKSLCQGAAQAVDLGIIEDPKQNPAYRFAISLCLLRDKKGIGTVVMMPYCNRLLSCADWFRQLWAESLGKKVNLKGETVHWGQTPEKALGATDQHSMVQLYMEGPFDKVICFLEVEDHDVDVVIPRVYPDNPDLDFWGGHTLETLINTEKQATEEALTQNHRPNLTARFPQVTAFSVGNFMMTLQIATVFAGSFLGIDPLDQPGVEMGKILTKERMKRQ